MEQFAKAKLQMDPQDEFFMTSAYSMGINAALKAVFGSDDEQLEKVTNEKLLPFIISIIKQKETALTGYDGKNVQNLGMNLLEQKCARGWLGQMAVALGAPDSVVDQLRDIKLPGDDRHKN